MSRHVSTVDAYNRRAKCGRAFESALKTADYKFRVKHCQHVDTFSPGMLRHVSAFSKQNKVLKQCWHFACQGFKH